MLPEPDEFADLTSKAIAGDVAARARLFDIVQDELHRIASRFIRPGRERFEVEHDMLVDDAFMRLTRPEPRWTSLAEFYGAASVTMRNLLTDSYRKLLRQEGIESLAARQIDIEAIPSQDPAHELIEIDDAIEAMWAINPECAEILDVRLLLGDNMSTTAHALQWPLGKAYRRWEMAQRLLKDLLLAQEPPAELRAKRPISRRIPIELTIDKQFNSFSDDDEHTLLEFLQDVLDYALPIHVITRRPGSTRITIALPEEQAEQLLWLYKRGVLDALGVRQAKIVGHALTVGLRSEKREHRDYDVFLCHNSDDKTEIRRIALKLRARGLIPWLDVWELQPGRPWQDTLEAQIPSIRSAAVFVGDAGIGPWQDMELKAFIREFVSRKCPVIPVMLRTCNSVPELPPFLNGMTWVDFRSRSPNPYDQLTWGITGRRPH